ncbi:MAG: hypothetical protein ACM3SX_24045 [Deltaproteobacteria bacterium]
MKTPLGFRLLLGMLGLAPSLSAQNTKQSQAHRLVLVIDAVTFEPVVGAVVEDSVWGNLTSTGPQGLARVDFLKPIADTGKLSRQALAIIHKVGYRPITMVVSLDDTASFTMSLGRVTALDAVVSTATYHIARDPGLRDGFARRCSVPHAACTGPDELITHPSAKLFDFLKKADGIFADCRTINPRPNNRLAFDRRGPVAPAEGGRTCVARMYKADSPGLCIPTYYLDGHLWSPLGGSAQDQLSDAFDPSSLEGIEVYASYKARPLRFAGDPACGVVLLWTKASSEKKN